MKNKLIIFLITILFLFALTGCSGRYTEVSQTALHFDTVVRVTLYGSKKEETHLSQVLEQVMDLCETYEDMLSRTKEGSDIYNINHAGGEWVTVSDETASLIYTALNYCDMTKGKIDITIAPVKDLWPFNAGGGITSSAPDKNTLSRALSHVNYHGIEIDGKRVRLSDPKAAIDLGFIAKGFIADEIKAYLIEEKVKSALIDLGGNILVLGEKPDGSPFHIGIQKPFGESGEYSAVVDASDKKGSYNTVVTSGIYERYFENYSIIYHHILDATTGRPASNSLYSTTILTTSSVNADALSTTCMVMGLDWSLDMISSLDGVDAIFITDEYELIDTRDGKS